MKIDEILTEVEKSKLKQVASDKVALEAIKKVILNGVYFQGTIRKELTPDAQINFCLAIASEPKITDEEIGSRMRASLAGVQLLETGFKELEKYCISPDYNKLTKNQAR